MSRHAIPIVVALGLALALAGVADAKQGEDKDNKAHGAVKAAKKAARDQDAPAPPAPETEPPAPEGAPPASTPPPAALTALPYVPTTFGSILILPAENPPPKAEPFATAPTPAPSLDERSTEETPVEETSVEETLGVPAPARMPARSSDTSGALPMPTERGFDGWRALAWAAPLLGLGGAATVLLLRRRGPAAAPAPPRAALRPVSGDDLPSILQNGHVAAAKGSLDEAVTWFDRALRIAPTLGVALFCKGVCLAASGRVADAYGALQAACEASPDDASYRIHFARAALALGKPKEAMDALALVAREMPELGEAMLADPQLAGLRDHPRFLMICGAL